MRRLAADRADDRPRLLDRDRAEQARGEGRLRRGEAPRVRGADAASRRASGSEPRRAGWCRASVRRPPSACAASGIDTLAALAAAPPRRSQRTSARGWRPSFSAGPDSRTNPPVTEERKVVSESREVTFDEDIRDPERLEAILAAAGRALVRGAPAHRATGPDDRHQGPARRLLHPHPRPHACRGGGVGRPGGTGGAGAAAAVRAPAAGPPARGARRRPRAGRSRRRRAAPTGSLSAGGPLAGAQWPGVRGSSRGGQEAAARRRQ